MKSVATSIDESATPFSTILLGGFCLFFYLLTATWGLHAAFQFRHINRSIKNKEKDDLEKLFLRTDTYTWSFWQSVLGSLTILPARSALALSCFSLGLLVSFFLVAWESQYYYDDHELCHMKKNRTSSTIFNCIFYYLTFWCIYCSGIRVRESSFDKHGNLKDGKIFRHELTTVISNHVAALDILYFVGSIQPGFVAKAAVKKMPFVGSIATVLGTVFVDRQASDSRESTLLSISSRQDLLNLQCENNKINHTSSMNLRPIVIFPEGTTTSGVGILKFKRGAFSNQKSVVNPVILTYSSPYYNQGLWIPSYDVVDMILYIPLTLSNLGNIRLNAYWYDTPIKRRETESAEAFTSRCERFMRANLEYLRHCGKLLGAQNDEQSKLPDIGSIPKRIATSDECLAAKSQFRYRILGRKDTYYDKYNPVPFEESGTKIKIN